MSPRQLRRHGAYVKPHYAVFGRNASNENSAEAGCGEFKTLEDQNKALNEALGLAAQPQATEAKAA